MNRYQLLTCLGLLAVVGCDTRDITVYNAPKAAPSAGMPSTNPSPAASATPAATPADFRPASVENMKFSIPANWQEDAKPRSMRLATFLVQQRGKTGEVIFSKFGAMQGTMADNMTRWNGQVGLPPVTEVNAADIPKVTIAGREAMLIDVAGPNPAAPTRRMIQVVANRDDGVYYIKLLGDAELVAGQKEAFVAFLASIEFAK